MPKSRYSTKIQSFLNRWIPPLIWVYFTGLFGWVVSYLLFKDAGYLFIINSIALYLFFALPLIGIFALIFKRPRIWGGIGLGVLVFIVIWGGFFLPKPNLPEPEKSITVMTYNVLGYRPDAQASIDVIRAEDVDIVLLQEVNPTLAKAYKKQLKEQYPYQILDPQEAVFGMGVLSKYPIQLLDDRLDMGWVGVPQILKVDWGENEFILVNFHMNVVSTRSRTTINDFTSYRNLQAIVLMEYAKQTDLPLVVAGDANTVFLSEVYEIITAELIDTWVEAGFGLGHTFPGSDIPGSSRPRFGSLYVPKWLVRIDYVFVSDDWGVASAMLAEFDGVSDHRGVIAELFLVSEE